MAEIATGSFAHTLEQIDDAVSEVSSTIGESASLTAAIEAIAEDEAETAAAAWYKVGTQITQGSDLNDYMSLGSYYVANNTDAGNVSNMPAQYGGRLDVIATIDNDSYCKQIYFANNDYGSIYARRKLSSGWSSWEQYATYSQVKYQVLGMGTAISASSTNPYDLNALTTIGRYYIGASASKYISHLPYSAGTSGVGCEVTVENIQTENRVRQTVVQNNGSSNIGKYWVRMAVSGTISGGNLSWSNWFLFEGTEVT